MIAALDLYRGDLLSGFYDDWIVLERERMRAIFDHLMAQLLERLQAEQRWHDVLEWGEHWIALGHSPEPAFRALMIAHSELGDMSKVATAYQRCVEALRDDLSVEPSEPTRVLFAQLKNKKSPIPQLSNSLLPSDEPPAPGEPPFKGLQYFDEKDAAWYFGREELIAKLVNQLLAAGLLVVIGASGSGKSSLVRAGLVPTLEREGSWQSHVITPTSAAA